MTTDDADAAPPPCPTCARWRKLAVYAFTAIDFALDADPGERIAILAEAAAELDGALAGEGLAAA